jgi:hypothetical protein
VESSEKTHFETLQVSPTAEPEVIAAAYRALARKYHPDRSSAPDAMVRMSRLNAAFQAVRGVSGRITIGDTRPDPPFNFPARLSPDRVDPGAPLEQILSTITRMMTVARQRVIDELTADGLAHDVATTLVATVVREMQPGSADSRKAHTQSAGARLDPNASYDDALRAVMDRARIIRDQLADELVREGLDRGAAAELTDESFERVRRKMRASGATEIRLTVERIDLAGPLDKGVVLVTEKLRAARQLVVDELTRDGVPLHTANQLVEAASETTARASRR